MVVMFLSRYLMLLFNFKFLILTTVVSTLRSAVVLDTMVCIRLSWLEQGAAVSVILVMSSFCAPGPTVVMQHLFALTVTGEQSFGCTLACDSSRWGYYQVQEAVCEDVSVLWQQLDKANTNVQMLQHKIKIKIYSIYFSCLLYYLYLHMILALSLIKRHVDPCVYYMITSNKTSHCRATHTHTHTHRCPNEGKRAFCWCVSIHTQFWFFKEFLLQELQFL